MKYESWKDYAELVGLAAVVGSLISVGLQLRQADDIAFAELSENTALRGIEMSALIADNADVWHKACSGEELTPAGRIIAANIYFRYQQGNFNAWARYRATGMGPVDAEFLTDSFAANIHRFPAIREMAESWAEWSLNESRISSEFVGEYRAAIQKRLKELQSVEPKPDADIQWCGIR